MTFHEYLGLEITEAGPDRVVGTLDCDERHQQPYGLTHGGVWTTIVETLGSTGGAMWAMEQGLKGVVGVHNATHFYRPHKRGLVEAVAEPIHRGRTQQVWQVTIRRSDDGKLVAQGELRVQNLSDDTITG